ncbi:MAG: D-tagatose-bisphosphate aldolase, class II, non-catalytic subunit [Sphingomicrobium sp.]
MIKRLVERHKDGEAIGLTSICSAHPLVVEAAMRHALRRGQRPLLIEATSNQVNQDGGYTGMTPVQFAKFLATLARQVGFPVEALVLGGDHLGPNAWTHLSAAEAMAKAATMVEAYIRAGFGKIHLDCSMRCADDPDVLPEATIAERSAALCRVAETAYAGSDIDAPVYVIGTEVPIPGGATEDLAALAVTTPEAALRTIELHRRAFAEAGVASAWPRVVATVVQPGVEFDHLKVVDYRPAAAAQLSAAIVPVPGMIFEAHSTDYQSADALAALVADHFAILKIGPGLTFALREALWALEAIERETVAPAECSQLRAVALERMHAAPEHWRHHYESTGRQLDLQLQYSLSDRIRYYWPDARIAAAQERLFANLRASPPNLPLLSQYLPSAFAAVRAGRCTRDPADLTMAHIGATLDDYYGACHRDA